jgi:selenide,water dikinase
MREFNVKGATDVTGFALLGHAWEMACASKVTIEIDSANVPVLKGALELAGKGMLTSGDKSNRDYVSGHIEIRDTVDKQLEHLLFDPQTAGGMLIAIAEAKAEALLSVLRKNYPEAAIVGTVSAPAMYSLIVM